jgi:cytochrome c
MDSFEINKVLGALLGTCLVLLAVHLASGAIFAPPVPAKPGYVIAVKEEQPAASTAAAKPAAVPIENFLASASLARGKETARECELCHNLGKGQGTKIGPDLYSVVGRKVASMPGFNYSSALKDSKVAKSAGGIWTFDKLNIWLTDPRADVPGTLMTFAGIDNEKQRADVIAYLNSNSDHPLPLPKAAQSKPAPAPAAKPTATAATTPSAPAAPAAKPAAPAPAAKPAAPAPSAAPAAKPASLAPSAASAAKPAAAPTANPPASPAPPAAAGSAPTK